MEKKLIVKCPTCKESFNYYTSSFRPFCCMRCRQVDLGHWFNETYAVASDPSTVNDEELVDEEEGS